MSWAMYGPYGCPLDPYKWLNELRSHGGLNTLDMQNLEEVFDPNLEMMIASHLGRGFDPGKKRAIQELRESVLKSKCILDDKVNDGRITRDNFARQVNELMRSFLEGGSQILSPEEFEQFFGETWMSDSVISLVNPEIAATYGKLDTSDIAKSA